MFVDVYTYIFITLKNRTFQFVSCVMGNKSSFLFRVFNYVQRISVPSALSSYTCKYPHSHLTVRSSHISGRTSHTPQGSIRRDSMHLHLPSQLSVQSYRHKYLTVSHQKHAAVVFPSCFSYRDATNVFIIHTDEKNNILISVCR